ncbi:MAG TPA: transcription elongation factor GreA [Candidatus Paceibacterota bacterium]
MYIPRRQWSRRPPPNDQPVYLTPEGVKRLKGRLERLKHSLPAVIEEAGRTAAYGDRSDNAEYKEAKGILRRTRGQILNIEDQLKRVVEIPAGADEAGKVRLGSTVVLEIKKGSDSTRKTFRIVGSSETDPTRGRISHTSPLGAALIGHAKDDTATIQTPGGKQEYYILEVK